MNKLREEIARVAYELYEKRGRGEGCHLDDWVEAERIVKARYKKKEVEREKPARSIKAKPAGAAIKEKKQAAAGKVSPKKKTTLRKTTAAKKTE
jgi:hypothetical protein